MTVSCLYFGRVMHRRLMPFRHRFAYRVFSLFADLDELPALGRTLRLFGHNRRSLFSFFDRDHGARDGAPLRPWVEKHLRGAGLDPTGGHIRVLCFPRVLGIVFNPLTVFYCYAADGALDAILYEVNNTFGEAHSYLLPVRHRNADTVEQTCEKGFYVSPFIGMTATYRFRLKPPAQSFTLLIRQSVAEGELLQAVMVGERAPLTDGSLLRAFFGYPLMTLKVILAIHWEALHLWRKGAQFHRRPEPPKHEATYG